MIKSVVLFIHTVKYLKLIQIFYRVKLYIFNKKVVSTHKKILTSNTNVNWLIQTHKKSSMLDHKTFIFLNKIGNYINDGWDNKSREKLWNYNLHYFDDLNSRNSINRKEFHKKLINDWIKDNFQFTGVGWEPFPTSLRIINWIKYFYSYKKPSSKEINSLIIQSRFLFSNIEFHILGNHLLTNAKALIFSGYFFKGNEAKKWFLKGLRILDNEVKEQIYKDGGHFERSPMYHNLVLEDFLDIINLLKDDKKYNRLVLNLKMISQKMILWMDGLTHQDGEISFFNDSALGIASRSVHLKKYARLLNIDFVENKNLKKGSYFDYKYFQNTGYLRLESKNAVAILDIADLGPDYLPGHGHADTLSFELSVHGYRVIVNAGTSTYEENQNRLWERSTKAHSTVEIDNYNSSEVWKSFRVGKRAKPFGMNINQNSDSIDISCSHDGYKRLSGRNIHKRFWEWRKKSLTIRDEIIGNYKQAIARFLLHPMISISKKKILNEYVLILPNKKNILLKVIIGASCIRQSKYSSQFGKQKITDVLMVSPIQNEIEIKIIW